MRGISSIRGNKPYKIPKERLEKKMAKLILTEDANTVVTFYQSKKLDTLNHDISEGALNALGYRLLSEAYLDRAISIFKLNIEDYPTSANPYDSYGDALLLKGDSLIALKTFKRCFEMDSTLLYLQKKNLKN
jgi:tetratricopeptide (TPR) repeat protein